MDFDIQFQCPVIEDYIVIVNMFLFFSFFGKWIKFTLKMFIKLKAVVKI